MSLSKRDIREAKINLAKIYNGLKEVCDLYELKLVFDKESYLDNSHETKISQIYNTKICNINKGYTQNKCIYYDVVYIEYIKNKRCGLHRYKTHLCSKQFFNWFYIIDILRDDFKDLPVFFLEKFQYLNVLTGCEMIIKDIIE